MTSECAVAFLRKSGFTVEQIQNIADAFAGEVVNVRNIVNDDQMADAKKMIREATYQELFFMDDILNEIRAVCFDESTLDILNDLLGYSARQSSKLIEEEYQRVTGKTE